MVVALKLARSIDNHSLVMRRFAEVSPAFPKDAIQGLDLIVQSIQEKGDHFWEDEEALKIFAEAAKNPDPDIQDHARHAQNTLLAMGKKQYLNVVPGV